MNKKQTCSIPIRASFCKTHFFNDIARTNENARRYSQNKPYNIIRGHPHNDNPLSPPQYKNDTQKRVVLQGTSQQSLQGQDVKYNECLDLKDDDHA